VTSKRKAELERKKPKITILSYSLFYNKFNCNKAVCQQAKIGSRHTAKSQKCKPLLEISLAVIVRAGGEGATVGGVGGGGGFRVLGMKFFIFTLTLQVKQTLVSFFFCAPAER